MYILLGLLFLGVSQSSATSDIDTHKVHCSSDWMKVSIVLPSTEKPLTPAEQLSEVYLEGLKGYPNTLCQPEIKDNIAEFRLSLKDYYQCGVTKITNKLTGKVVFHHRIIIQTEDVKEMVNVKCIITSGPMYNVTRQGHSIARRDVLPAGFEEPIDLEITTSLTERAPEPILGVAVRQGGQLVTGELNVSPGTPLAMEIYLDKASAPVYGLGVTYMQVTDTKSQEETIIFNGCSVDPYLFDNFNTVDGDFLTAKFRAFKFPDSTYVQFRGTVNVCLDKCKGVQCSNGHIGYGRRKRSIESPIIDPNKVYEISMTTFIKVTSEGGADQNAITELEQKLKQLKIANQKLERNSRGSVFESVQDRKFDQQQQQQQQQKVDATDAIVEETTLFRFQNNGAIKCASHFSQIIILAVIPLLSFVIKRFL